MANRQGNKYANVRAYNLQEKPCMEMKKVWILFSVDVDGSY